MKKKMTVLFLVIISMLIFPTSFANAGDGKLVINDEKILDKNKVSDEVTSSIGYKMNPNLFLEEQTKNEKTLKKKEKEEINKANAENFIKKEPESADITASVKDKLFTKELNTNTVSSSTGTEEKQEISFATWIVIYVICGVLVIGLGIYLGVKFSRRKSKKSY
ncbi:MAG: type VII secretion protein EssA [Lachnospiraceae bacterium]|jgi:type VII secretion protein EssA|nr:type VII secretion protein EssA [Lachnospiraceae bacterium]